MWSTSWYQLRLRPQTYNYPSVSELTLDKGITMTSLWARWLLKSPASWVFTQPFNQEQIKKHRSSASLAFVRGIHRRPVNSPHKEPVAQIMFPSDDVIMAYQLVPNHNKHNKCKQWAYLFGFTTCIIIGRENKPGWWFAHHLPCKVVKILNEWKF